MAKNVKIIKNIKMCQGVTAIVSQKFEEFENEKFLLFYINAIEYSINQINNIKKEKTKREKSFFYHFFVITYFLI